MLGDPDRLQQVVWNLVCNAVKFTPQGGRIDVRLRQEDSHVALAVHDTGKGISPEFLPYVFERFRQADSTSTRSHGGLGLGLAIVRHLVELHGGTVHAESERRRTRARRSPSACPCMARRGGRRRRSRPRPPDGAARTCASTACGCWWWRTRPTCATS